MKITYFVCMVTALFVFSGCVESQKVNVLENRLAALEMSNNRQLARQNQNLKSAAEQNQQVQLTLKKDLDAVEKKLAGAHLLTREAYAELKYDIQTIKEELQRLEGLIEEVNHSFLNFSRNGQDSVETQLERLDQAISKNYEKVIRLEKYMGFEPSAAGDIENKIVSSEGPDKTPEQQLYDRAKKLFDDGDKEAARIQFENFINKYPNSDNADNARFWIADSYYSEKWFEKAILEYQKVLEEYPGSNKLAAARLKQGYAFAELGEKANARLILKELVKKHPGSNEAKYAQEKLKSLN